MAGIKRVLDALRRETPVLTRQAEEYPVLRSRTAGDTPVDPTGIPISALPGADTPNDNDVFAIVQDDTTKKSRLGSLLAWIKGQLSPSDIGAQGEILVSGLLKGNGVGGISAAQPGTDYGTYSKPSGGIPASDLANGVIPTVPAASTANPQMDGAVSPGSTGEWADGGHIHPTDTTRASAALEINGHPLTGDFNLSAADVGALASNGTAVSANTLAAQHIIGVGKDTGWYAFAEFTVSNSNSRTYDILIDSTYHSSSADETSHYESGILRVYLSRSSGGAVSRNVCWLTTIFRVDDVKFLVESVDSSQSKITLYIYKSSNTGGALVFRCLSSAHRGGTTISSITWLSTAVEVPVDASIATYMLTSSHKLIGDVGWYKFLDITLGVNVTRIMTLLIDSSYAIPTPMGSCIVRIYFNRQSNGTPNVGVRMLATHIPASWLRYSYTNNTLSLYIYKSTSVSGGLYFRALSCSDRAGNPVMLGSFFWQSVAVEEPTSASISDDYTEIHARAADYDGNGKNIADGVLRFSSVAVSAGTAQQILSISNAKITADYVLARIEFADPSYITTGYSWTTSAGSFTLTGTATAATTADILLVRKGN